MRIYRPVSDLQNHLDEISEIAHETGQPVFLTKDGRVDMVLMSIETYKAMLTADELETLEDAFLLEEAKRRMAENAQPTTSYEDVLKEFGMMREDLDEVDIEVEHPGRPLSYQSMSAKQFDAELEKGVQDIREGRTTPAEDILKPQDNKV